VPYKDKKFHAEWRKHRIDSNREYVRAIKESNPCADCGNRYPFYVMQFDHLRDKYMDVSRMMAHSLELIMKEISKCELVCANCHAARGYLRGVVGQMVETPVCEAGLMGSIPIHRPIGQ
jgi:hypothetical protein